MPTDLSIAFEPRLPCSLCPPWSKFFHHEVRPVPNFTNTSNSSKKDLQVRAFEVGDEDRMESNLRFLLSWNTSPESTSDGETADQGGAAFCWPTIPAIPIFLFGKGTQPLPAPIAIPQPIKITTFSTSFLSFPHPPIQKCEIDWSEPTDWIECNAALIYFRVPSPP